MKIKAVKQSLLTGLQAVQNIITQEIEKAGFSILMAKYINPVGKDPFGSLTVAATKN